MKHKETIVHKCFQHKLSSSGVRKETDRPLLCFLLLLLYVSLLKTQGRQYLLKMLVYYCFIVFRRTDEYISLYLFYFVILISSCSLLPQIYFGLFVMA